ncbi:MAG TPA: FAD:protein FMN transferase [Microbacterium sp.]|uniref:FAD:protein FMN transferase n=1 Tax=Microbacterium sp. TaxID=51671 RepID=UPI002B7444E1|nr:FAD:protein FMN transferase [Microbacterium sp.]HWI32366.1 FAD:protein FMN transferase [Microbacterium sp.]
MPESAPASWRFEAIGTPWEIQTPTPLRPIARAEVTTLIADFDAAWSRFRPDSLVARLARGERSVLAPPDTDAMLAAYGELSDATGGAVNPLVGAALDRLGYGPGYRLAEAGEPARSVPAAWRDIVSWDLRRLSLSEPATIDVGALGKGRLVDRVLDVVTSHVEGDVVVDASGDLAVRGVPVRIGLEHPFDATRAIGVVTIQDAALCASATNRRTWGDGLHHVLDARTGMPVRTISATWAIAPDAMHADAVATALFFDGGPRLAHEWGVQWVRMLTDGRVEYSPGSAAELFSGPATVES